MLIQKYTGIVPPFLRYNFLNKFFSSLNEQVGHKRPDLRTRNYCIRDRSSMERRVEPGK